MNSVVRGAVAGLLATGPMTAVMKVLHRRLPWYQRYSLPPRQITMELTKKVGLYHELGESEKRIATLVAHYGYGMAAAVPYVPLTRRLPLPPTAKGATYGLAIWAGSYLGLIPQLDLLAPATRHPKERVALMIAAHVVWGVGLALIADQLESNSTTRRLPRNRRPRQLRLSKRQPGSFAVS